VAEGGFAFAFAEGALVRALRSGAWLLLDEVNLAPPEVGALCAAPVAGSCATKHALVCICRRAPAVSSAGDWSGQDVAAE